jgi:hypothetical protein
MRYHPILGTHRFQCLKKIMSRTCIAYEEPGGLLARPIHTGLDSDREQDDAPQPSFQSR